MDHEFRQSGVALIRLTRRTKNKMIAETASGQIEAALEILRSGGRASATAFLVSRLHEIRSVRDGLKTDLMTWKHDVTPTWSHVKMNLSYIGC
jgi:hypothetical protein